MGSNFVSETGAVYSGTKFSTLLGCSFQCIFPRFQKSRHLLAKPFRTHVLPVKKALDFSSKVSPDQGLFLRMTQFNFQRCGVTHSCFADLGFGGIHFQHLGIGAPALAGAVGGYM
nr:hypothetical protein [Pseudomonas syringae pv. actinidiae]